MMAGVHVMRNLTSSPYSQRIGYFGRTALKGRKPSWPLPFRKKTTTSSLSSTSASSSSLSITLVPCLKDNYAYLLHDIETNTTGIVDPSEPEPVIDVLGKKGLGLTYILNTHHHWDHTGGNLALKNKYSSQVIGPFADKDRIPGIDIALQDGEIQLFGKQEMHVLDTPGHTSGHVCFYFPASKAIFTGDTLFSLSCGKLFEGTPGQMWTSLSKISALPDDTRIYCGHEYTLSSAEFAIAIDPSNEALHIYYEKIKGLRQKCLPTIPTSLGQEKACNPFLRLGSLEVRKSVGISPNANESDVLAAVRTAKDRWRG